MNNMFTKFKKITAISAMFALLLMQNSSLILGFGILNSANKISTVNAVYTSTEITLTNSNFESPTSTAYPISPNSWSKVNEDTSVTSGLINVSSSVYDENYEDYNLTFNPSKDLSVETNENSVLMINAESESTKMGYRSANISLAKNGYYTIEALVYTQKTDGITTAASMYLTGDSQITDSENSKMLAINTAGVWKSYKFFVQTDGLSNKTVNLELYLGSKDAFTSQGTVFFDNVQVYSHSHDRYFSEINNLGLLQDNYRILNLQEKVVENAIVNSNFEQTIVDPETNNLGWEILTAMDSVADSEYAINGVYNIDDNFNATETGVDASPTNANIYGNTKALLINNINPASIGYKSSDILIEQHKLYRLSLLVKTSNLTNGATIKLIQQNPYGEENTTYTPLSVSLKNINTSTATNAKFENWIEYSFAIKGNVFLDSYANLELWLGNEEVNEVGYAFFDNVQLFELTSAQYNTITTSDAVSFADFSNITGTSDVANSNFNKVTIDSVEETYPYAPQNWTVGSNSDNYAFAEINNGVINTNTAQFISNSANYSGFINPGNLDNQINDAISNNILVVGNVSSTSQYYTSTAKSLTALSYYKLSFYLETQGLATNKVTVRLLNDANPIIALNNLGSDLTWTKYSVYIKTGTASVNAIIKLMLGDLNQETTGFAFFDNVTISTIESADYTSAKTLQANNTSFVDLNSENFIATSANTTEGLYAPLNYTGEKKSTQVNDEFINAGVLDTDNFNASYFPGLTNPNSASEDTSNVLMISASDDAYYTYTSNSQYAITSGKYYKFSVFVKTFGLSQNVTNLELDEEDNPVIFGAGVALSGFDNSFTAINTQLDAVSNEYQEYVFYINPLQDKSFNLILSLGNTDALTKGYAFFSNISLTTIDEDSYNESIAILTGDNAPTNMLNLETTPVEEEELEETAPEGINFDFLLFPTLMFGLALIIAIIGYSIRQIKFNKIIRKRIKTAIYNRNRTLAVDHERREVVKERQERLAKLKEQLSQIQNEITTNEQEFKISKQQLKELTDEQIDKKDVKNLTDKQIKTYTDNKKQALKKQREQAYTEKREKLEREFERIEKEIEKLEKEERIMFEKYRNYRAQIKAIKLEIKQKQKDARLRLKLKKQKAKEKKLVDKQTK
ncbi:MAG: hypothetical protein PHC46_03350 [Clostridia bacterium]|nr:hypothetical protein [Clostridia bacterium]